MSKQPMPSLIHTRFESTQFRVLGWFGALRCKAIVLILIFKQFATRCFVFIAWDLERHITEVLLAFGWFNTVKQKAWPARLPKSQAPTSPCVKNWLHPEFGESYACVALLPFHWQLEKQQGWLVEKNTCPLSSLLLRLRCLHDLHTYSNFFWKLSENLPSWSGPSKHAFK